ncbi:MAG: hypothetical protein IJ642_02760 [Oscillospiraceae bacterium]|nr:hypothetical protein [Oscillospiraceae bacterium]
MGIVTIRAVFYILMVIVSGSMFLYTVVAGGLTWIKAANAGILQFHKIFHRAFYWIYYVIVIASLAVSVFNFTEARTCRSVVEDSQAVGIQAFLAYEEEISQMQIENEEVYLSQKTAEYLQKMSHHQQNGFFYLFMAMLWFSMMMMNTGFVTLKGYYPFGVQRPKRILIEAREGELYFYLAVNKKRKENKPLMKMKDTPENRSYCEPLFRKRKQVKGS